MFLIILKKRRKCQKEKIKLEYYIHFLIKIKRKINKKTEELSSIQKYLTNIDETFFDISQYTTKHDICE